jgi:hypothetical protein
MESEKKRGRGRPPREFDKKIFENLCAIQCTVDEIELVLSSYNKTLDKWCRKNYDHSLREVMDRFKAHGRASLRRSQFELAKKNAGMAIFLGKNYLGQTDQIVNQVQMQETVQIYLPDNGRSD